MKDNYAEGFFKDRHQKTNHAAATILSIVMEALPDIHSAVDIGCGVGTWLAVLKQKGIDDVLGLDGPWVNKTLLEIPENNFLQINFEEQLTLEKKYDLALSLEVAEHLSSDTAIRLINSLTAASDFVLFSAAIPYQGGSGHINEQWQDYWSELFAARGYTTIDLVRSQIWDDSGIPAWYRQNILLYVKNEQIDKVRLPEWFHHGPKLPLSLVHPDTFQAMMEYHTSPKQNWKKMRRSIKEAVKNTWRK